jgi:hypothetical protein
VIVEGGRRVERILGRGKGKLPGLELLIAYLVLISGELFEKIIAKHNPTLRVEELDTSGNVEASDDWKVIV